MSSSNNTNEETLENIHVPMSAIQLNRSDGMKHDLSSMINRSGSHGISNIVSNAQQELSNIKDNSDFHEEKHGTISINRSDGKGHDIQSVLKSQNEKDTTNKSSWKNFSPKISFSRSLSTGSSNSTISELSKENSIFLHPKSVRIAHMSDTFNHLKPSGKKEFMPFGEILVHSGNFTCKGTEEEFQQFDSWLASMKDYYHYRIVCLGHKDVGRFGTDWDTYKSLLPSATHVLCNEEANILGIRFYGCPWHWGYKFNYVIKPSVSSAINTRYNDIPENIDILITHGPAYGRLDRTFDGEHVGSRELMDALRKAKPLVHLHGHLSEGRGIFPHFGHLPLTLNSAMCDKSRKIMYACPQVIKSIQISNSNQVANNSSWDFNIDSLI